jgi:hypothetical protein
MKRLLLFFLLSSGMSLYAQVVSFPKTLPERTWSVGLTPAYHFDRDVVLFDAGGAAFALSGGYGILYPLDVNARYTYFVNGPDYIGIDMQYLVYETRNTYVSVLGGLHYWDVFGCDISAYVSYTPRFEWSISGGLDLDLSFAEDLHPRFWIPFNVGYNLSEMIFLFAEYKLPVSDLSWGIASLGVNILLR